MHPKEDQECGHHIVKFNLLIFLTIKQPNIHPHIDFSYNILTVFFFFQRKRKAKLKSDGQVNGVDPLAEDDDERLKEIAKQFEEKYVSIVFTWKRK